MPRRKHPHDLRTMHGPIHDRLVDWFVRKIGSAEPPLKLAGEHLAKHLQPDYQCRVCGAAKAIIDYESLIAEQDGYRLVEALRSAHQELILSRRKLEKALRAYLSSYLARKKQVLSSPDVVKKKKGQELDGTPGSAGSKAPSTLVQLADVLLDWKFLVTNLTSKKKEMAARFASPVLAEMRRSWPRDYIETRINCYLIQHGWSAEEIVPILFPDVKSARSKVRSIKDQVRRAKKSSRPPLAFGWPGVDDKKEASRLLSVVKAANRDVNTVRTRK